ncbi:MAG: hypothetical protein U9M90_00640 [Patescibacteria group bacterium]|nr:hypothetical protein [Patescibacteria group bacterium]
MGPAISIVPHTFDLTVEPGEEKSDRIKVYNQGEVAVPFTLKMVEFGAKELTGEMMMLERNEDQQTPSDWIEFEKEDFVVDPGQKEAINFSVHIPDDAEPQGYYAMALFEADISTLYFNESRVQIVPSMGVLFMLKVAGGEEAEEALTLLEYSVLDQHHLKGAEKIANFLAQPFISDDEQINVIKSEQPTFLVKIKNNDPYHKKLSGSIKLSGVGWKLENELEVQPVTILPGMTREILVKGAAKKDKQEGGQDRKEEYLGKEGSFGFMQADLKIEEEQGFTKQQQQWIIVFSWKMAVLFLLAIACIVAPVWIVRSRRKKVYPVKSPQKRGAKLFNRVKLKPKFKKHSFRIIRKAEKKTRDDVGIKTTGEETLVSSHGKTRRKPANKKAKKSPKGGSSSGRKTTKKAVRETVTKRTRKGSPRAKQQIRKTVTRKPARKKASKKEDKKTNQRKTKRSSRTAKPRKRKITKRRAVARKSPAKKSARKSTASAGQKRTKKGPLKTKQQKRKTAGRKNTKKKVAKKTISEKKTKRKPPAKKNSQKKSCQTENRSQEKKS